MADEEFVFRTPELLKARDERKMALLRQHDATFVKRNAANSASLQLNIDNLSDDEETPDNSQQQQQPQPSSSTASTRQGFLFTQAQLTNAATRTLILSVKTTASIAVAYERGSDSTPADESPSNNGNGISSAVRDTVHLQVWNSVMGKSLIRIVQPREKTANLKALENATTSTVVLAIDNIRMAPAEQRVRNVLSSSTNAAASLSLAIDVRTVDIVQYGLLVGQVHTLCQGPTAEDADARGPVPGAFISVPVSSSSALHSVSVGKSKKRPRETTADDSESVFVPVDDVRDLEAMKYLQHVLVSFEPGAVRLQGLRKKPPFGHAKKDGDDDDTPPEAPTPLRTSTGHVVRVSGRDSTKHVTFAATKSSSSTSVLLDNVNGASKGESSSDDDEDGFHDDFASSAKPSAVSKNGDDTKPQQQVVATPTAGQTKRKASKGPKFDVSVTFELEKRPPRSKTAAGTEKKEEEQSKKEETGQDDNAGITPTEPMQGTVKRFDEDDDDE